MRALHLFTLLSVALLALLCVPHPALAGGNKKTGWIDVYVFTSKGEPAKLKKVFVSGVEGQTNALGLVRFQVKKGQAILRVPGPKGEALQVPVPVAARMVTDVILRLSGSGKPTLVDIDAPRTLDEEKAPRKTNQKATEFGILAGQIINSKKEAIVGAKVLVRGFRGEGVTDEKGQYALKLPVGEYSLSVIHPEYATETVAGLTIKKNKAREVNFTLTETALLLETVAVSGYAIKGGLAKLLEERQDDTEVSDVIGSEQISKAGDSNAASALRRVTGLSVVGGRYVYVRGMGERYSSTLLNSSTLPSPEPTRRVVPLDLIPTDVIESVKIQKTYSADMPGEFGGGSVLIRTKGLPTKRIVKFGVSAGANSETTFKNGLAYRGGDTDFLGRDDGTRELPLPVRAATDNQQLFLRDQVSNDGFSAQELETLGESLPNIWEARSKTVPLNTSMKATYGDRIETGGAPFGFLVSMNYSNSFTTRRERIRALGIGSGELNPLVDYRSRSTTNTVNVGGIISGGVELGEDEYIKLTSLLVRTTRNKAEIYEGLLTDDDLNLRVTQLTFTEEMLWSNQVAGSHKLFGDIGLEYQYAFSMASRESPDQRRQRYDFDENINAFVLSNRPEGNQRIYGELQDYNHDGGVKLTLPFSSFAERIGKIKTGVNFVSRTREAETRRFKFINRGPNSRDIQILQRPIEQIFAPENIGPNGFSFEEITRATDSYEAEQEIFSTFLVLDIPLTESFEISTGLRLEQSRQEVTTFNLFDRGSNAIVADLDTEDYLPSLSATWKFVQNMQLRAAYSRTLSRPDFRELSEAPFDLIIGTGVFQGNSQLDRSLIDNFDLRWEWYFSPQESMSIGVFYKQLKNPIENIIRGGANRTTTLDNAPEGRNIGIEFDIRKQLLSLGQQIGLPENIAENLFLGFNITLIDSVVKLGEDGVQTERRRPLQGQSEYIINFSISYDNPKTKTSIALLYNVAGERIVGIGALGLPDVIEQPFHNLDFTASWLILKNTSFGIKLTNILNSEVIYRQKKETTRRFKRGVSVSAGITVSF